jgi:hypothetical protein
LRFVENKGYEQLKSLNFSNKKVLEIGPGVMPHFKFIKDNPKKYDLFDVNKNYLVLSANSLKKEKFLVQNLI